MAKKLGFVLSLLVFVTLISHAKVKVNSLSANQNQNFDKILFGASETRDVALINDGWKAYPENDPENRVSISVPAIFDGNDIIVFEKWIYLTTLQVEKFNIKLGFLGLNNSAEISINGNIIANHYGGAFPFEVSLPKDLLRPDASNKICVKINKKLDSETTIPTKQRFLFPQLDGGILRDVYIKMVPQLSIAKIDFSYSLDQLTSGKVHFDVQVENAKTLTGINNQTQFYVHVNIYSPGSGTSIAKGDFLQTIYNEDKYDSQFQLDVANPNLWSPTSPNLYTCEVTLLKDGAVVDKLERKIAFYNLKKSQQGLFLNGNPFAFSGTTYLLNETYERETNIYEKIKEDLTFIKQTGFNAVRFSKNYPNPYALKVCQELGLFSFIELPINSVPQEFLSQNDYQIKCAGFIKELSSNYYDYANATLVGIGSGFLANSSETENFIARISAELKKKNLFTYASFSGWQSQAIANLDFYGYEVFSSPTDNVSEQIENVISSIGNSSVLFSEITYPNYNGEASGYLVKNSNEAQAKYFDDLIGLTQKKKLSGFFINSLLKYQGNYISLYSGYRSDKFYNFSVLEPSKNTNTIAYKVLYSHLNNGSKVTIPIGSKKDDSPLLFILVALILSVIVAVLINTKKKFREDATRALLRPYNFFSDIRDLRIISGAHTAILMLILAASASLFVTILLYYFRNNILLEKFLLSFASRTLMDAFSFLVWNPLYCFIILFVVSIIKFAFISLLIKASSFFIKTYVPFLNIYFTVIWAFLPLTLFLPIELVLFKVLMMQSFNTTVFITLALLFLWIVFRIAKGIYVIFDVRPLLVYLYSALFFIIVLGIVVLKYQLTHSIIQYVGNAFKQYNSMIS